MIGFARQVVGFFQDFFADRRCPSSLSQVVVLLLTLEAFRHLSTCQLQCGVELLNPVLPFFCLWCGYLVGQTSGRLQFPTQVQVGGRVSGRRAGGRVVGELEFHQPYIPSLLYLLDVLGYNRLNYPIGAFHRVALWRVGRRQALLDLEFGA